MNSTIKAAIFMLVAFGMVGLMSEAAHGHTAFKKHFEKKYGNLKVKCDACHVPDEPKNVRNEFGKLFYKQLKDKDLTAQWREIEDRKEKKAFERDVMTPAFDKALEAVKKMENADGENYGELIAAGKIPLIAIKEDD